MPNKLTCGCRDVVSPTAMSLHFPVSSGLVLLIVMPQDVVVGWKEILVSVSHGRPLSDAPLVHKMSGSL